MFLQMLLTSFFLGLSGSVHCSLMCGPLASLSCKGQNQKTGYFVARIATYTILGFASGLLMTTVVKPYFQNTSRFFAIAFGTVLALISTIQLISLIFKKNLFFSFKSLPLKNVNYFINTAISRSPFSKPVTLGAITGLLPCGLLYLALLQAALFAHPLKSGIAMAVFGLSTTPALWLSTQAIDFAKKSKILSSRFLFPLLTMISALLILLRSLVSHPFSIVERYLPFLASICH